MPNTVRKGIPHPTYCSMSATLSFSTGSLFSKRPTRTEPLLYTQYKPKCILPPTNTSCHYCKWPRVLVSVACLQTTSQQQLNNELIKVSLFFSVRTGHKWKARRPENYPTASSLDEEEIMERKDCFHKPLRLTVMVRVILHCRCCDVWSVLDPPTALFSVSTWRRCTYISWESMKAADISGKDVPKILQG